MFDVENLANYSLNHAAQILNLKKSQVSNIRIGTRELTTLEAILLRQDQNDRLLNFFNYVEDDRLFWINIEKLQELLAYSDEAMAACFSLDLRSFRFNRSRCKSLPLSSTNFFHMKYKLNPVLWFTHDIDLECLAKNMSSLFKSNALLPKIFDGGGSKIRTLANTVQFVSQKWGEACARELIGSLQITNDALQFSEKSISIRVFATIHKKIRSFGATDDDFIEMGSFNRVNARNVKMLAQKIPEELTLPHQVMSYFVNNLIMTIDSNKKYRVLESTPSIFIAEGTPTDLFYEKFKPYPVFSEYEIGLFVLGHLKVIPTYFGFREFSKIEMSFDEKSGKGIYIAHF